MGAEPHYAGFPGASLPSLSACTTPSPSQVPGWCRLCPTRSHSDGRAASVPGLPLSGVGLLDPRCAQQPREVGLCFVAFTCGGGNPGPERVGNGPWSHSLGSSLAPEAPE